MEGGIKGGMRQDVEFWDRREVMKGGGADVWRGGGGDLEIPILSKLLGMTALVQWEGQKG